MRMRHVRGEENNEWMEEWFFFLFYSAGRKLPSPPPPPPPRPLCARPSFSSSPFLSRPLASTRQSEFAHFSSCPIIQRSMERTEHEIPHPKTGTGKAHRHRLFPIISSSSLLSLSPSCHRSQMRETVCVQVCVCVGQACVVKGRQASAVCVVACVCVCMR